MVKSLPAKAADMGSTSGSGRFPHASEQLSPWTTTTEACVPRAYAPQKETPPQGEACSLQLESPPQKETPPQGEACSPQLESPPLEATRESLYPVQPRINQLIKSDFFKAKKNFKLNILTK